MTKAQRKKRRKKIRKLIVSVLAAIMLITIIICGAILTYNRFSNSSNSNIDNSNSNNNEEIADDIIIEYETKEEVISGIYKRLKEENLNLTVEYDYEENGCWYYKTSNPNITYSYCIDEQIIRGEVTSYEISKGK
jgi:archaellum component FlaF (FlaF/FlaG flagellin family)